MMSPCRFELFTKLSQTGGVSLVEGRDGLTRIVVNDPWMVAHKPTMVFSTGMLVVSGFLGVIGLMMTSMNLLGFAALLTVIAMFVRLMAPRMSGLPVWNDFLVLGDTRDLPVNKSE